MRSEIPFKNKFADYLTKKITPQKIDTLFNGQFSQQSHSSSSQSCNTISISNNSSLFDDNSLSCTPNSNISIFSFNSSEFTQSKYKSPNCGENGSSVRKRLKKLRELQQNECAICLDQIKSRCQLQCKHKFCYDCLQQWLKNSSKCPYCRNEVHFFWFKGEEYKVQAKEFQYQGGEQQNLDWVCYLCDQTEDGDIVLICDRCEANACHIDCDQILNGVQPRGQWICHFCR